MTPRDLLLSNRGYIRKVAKHAAQRHKLSPQDTEDFVSEFELKLLEDDCRVVRMHKEKSSFRTYVSTVSQNFLRDYKNRLWGKFRPSAEARRLGPLGVKLDELLYRDHYTLDQACKLLKTNYHVEKSEREIRAMAALLPPHGTRQIEDDKDLDKDPSPAPSSLQTLLDRERVARMREALGVLDELLSTLPDEDRLILQMTGEFQVSEIARLLELPQRSLYPRIAKIRKQLRSALEDRGIDYTEIAGYLPPEEER